MYFSIIPKRSAKKLILTVLVTSIRSNEIFVHFRQVNQITYISECYWCVQLMTNVSFVSILFYSIAFYIPINSIQFSLFLPFPTLSCLHQNSDVVYVLSNISLYIPWLLLRSFVSLTAHRQISCALLRKWEINAGEWRKRTRCITCYLHASDAERCSFQTLLHAC